MVSVYIVASVPAVRAGLQAMLEQAGLQLVEHPPADVLVVADPAALEELATGVALQAVVLLSGDERQANSLQALDLDGWALLPEETSAEQLAAAVNAAAAGLVVVPAPSARAMLPQPAELSEPLQEPLTPRELEVLQLVSHGLSNKLIARQLGISEHTVKFHVSSTYAKLGAASRTEAMSMAARRGLITL